MIFYIIIPIFVYLIYITNTCEVVTACISDKYTRWGQLTQLVSSRENNRLKVIYYSIKILLEALYINFIQYMNSSVRKINNQTYEVTYVLAGRLYKMRISAKGGPPPVWFIRDELNIDVTDKILPYIGPLFDWHGANVSPDVLGYKSLTFVLSNGAECVYTNKSIININN